MWSRWVCELGCWNLEQTNSQTCVCIDFYRRWHVYSIFDGCLSRVMTRKLLQVLKKLCMTRDNGMVRDYFHISIAGRSEAICKQFVFFRCIENYYVALSCCWMYVKAFSIIIDFDIYSLLWCIFVCKSSRWRCWSPSTFAVWYGLLFGSKSNQHRS